MYPTTGRFCSSCINNVYISVLPYKYVVIAHYTLINTDRHLEAMVSFYWYDEYWCCSFTTVWRSAAFLVRLSCSYQTIVISNILYFRHPSLPRHHLCICANYATLYSTSRCQHLCNHAFHNVAIRLYHCRCTTESNAPYSPPSTMPMHFSGGVSWDSWDICSTILFISLMCYLILGVARVIIRFLLGIKVCIILHGRKDGGHLSCYAKPTAKQWSSAGKIVDPWKPSTIICDLLERTHADPSEAAAAAFCQQRLPCVETIIRAGTHLIRRQENTKNIFVIFVFEKICICFMMRRSAFWWTWLNAESNVNVISTYWWSWE